MSNKWLNNAYNCTPSISTLTLELRQRGVRGTEGIQEQGRIQDFSPKGGGVHFPQGADFQEGQETPPLYTNVQEFYSFKGLFQGILKL